MFFRIAEGTGICSVTLIQRSGFGNRSGMPACAASSMLRAETLKAPFSRIEMASTVLEAHLHYERFIRRETFHHA
jgi:hypothetical protein